MQSKQIENILEKLLQGELSLEQAVEQFRDFPICNLLHTRLDTQRELRSGFGEVIFAEGKELDQLCEIVASNLAVTGKVLLTRIRQEHFEGLCRKFPNFFYDRRARIAYHLPAEQSAGIGRVGIISAGTSDQAVAAEAARSCEFFGLEVQEIYDVGIAGLPRLVEVIPELRRQDVLIVVAGMEGALPGVVSSLCPAPVIAVPTSVGYGACFGGLTALLGMLVSCSPGLTVVNIDNGFGAALAAAKMVRHLTQSRC